MEYLKKNDKIAIVSTARKMQEMSYPAGLYIDNVDTTNKWKWDPKMNEKMIAACNKIDHGLNSVPIKY